MAEAIAQRRMHLERRVAHALAKIGGTTGTHNNDNQVVVTSERDAIAVLQRTRVAFLQQQKHTHTLL